MDLHLEVVDDATGLGRVAADAVSGFLDARGALTP